MELTAEASAEESTVSVYMTDSIIVDDLDVAVEGLEVSGQDLIRNLIQVIKKQHSSIKTLTERINYQEKTFQDKFYLLELEKEKRNNDAIFDFNGLQMTSSENGEVVLTIEGDENNETPPIAVEVDDIVENSVVENKATDNISRPTSASRVIELI
jgi:hypothetical protein